jgi:hypothetical protein
MAMEILLAVLGGSALTAIINQIGTYIQARKNYSESHEDKENNDMAIIKKALRYILLDRIRYVGQHYIRQKEIDFDDRRILNDMHDIYHNGLGGNGDLTQLMNEVNKLPLKL